MKINLKYYYATNGNYNRHDGELILKNRRVVSNGLEAIAGKPRKFFFDATDMNIQLKPDDRKSSVKVNGIITESDYSNTQREYLVQLTWLQRQKMNWMFKRHWLQQGTNFIHLLIALFLVLMIFVSIDFITGHL